MHVPSRVQRREWIADRNGATPMQFKHSIGASQCPRPFSDDWLSWEELIVDEDLALVVDDQKLQAPEQDCVALGG
jgi:hypothetical protein